MPKAYWVTWYRAIRDQAAHAKYAALAGPAIQSNGGTFPCGACRRRRQKASRTSEPLFSSSKVSFRRWPRYSLDTRPRWQRSVKRLTSSPVLFSSSSRTFAMKVHPFTSASDACVITSAHASSCAFCFAP